MENWTRVRVTDMRGVDLNVYRFNYDLTMAVLLMHPNGTIYSTYAGRDFTNADSHQSSSSLARVLDEALKLHRADLPAPKRVKRLNKPYKKPLKKPLSVEQLPWWKAKEKRENKQPKCYHCHNVNDGYAHEGRRTKRWTDKDQFDWPDPIQAGLRFDREGQVVVSEAKPATGLRKGDRIVAIGGIRPIAYGDIQRALNDAPWGRNRLKVEWMRGTEKMSGAINLKSGWKKPTPEICADRASMWPMSPKPGFGGPLLTSEEKIRAGLPEDRWAFRVNYIVTWGGNSYTGRNAKKAGIRKNMIVYSADGKHDFKSMGHFHAWFRMTRKVGKPIRLKVIHKGARQTLTMRVLP